MDNHGLTRERNTSKECTDYGLVYDLCIALGFIIGLVPISVFLIGRELFRPPGSGRNSVFYGSYWHDTKPIYRPSEGERMHRERMTIMTAHVADLARVAQELRKSGYTVFCEPKRAKGRWIMIAEKPTGKSANVNVGAGSPT